MLVRLKNTLCESLYGTVGRLDPIYLDRTIGLILTYIRHYVDNIGCNTHKRSVDRSNLADRKHTSSFVILWSRLR